MNSKDENPLISSLINKQKMVLAALVFIAVYAVLSLIGSHLNQLILGHYYGANIAANVISILLVLRIMAIRAFSTRIIVSFALFIALVACLYMAVFPAIAKIFLVQEFLPLSGMEYLWVGVVNFFVATVTLTIANRKRVAG